MFICTSRDLHPQFFIPDSQSVLYIFIYVFILFFKGFEEGLISSILQNSECYLLP